MRTAESSKNAQASPEMREILFDLKCNANASLKSRSLASTLRCKWLKVIDVAVAYAPRKAGEHEGKFVSSDAWLLSMRHEFPVFRYFTI
jgi:hypothetical protein